MNTSSNSPLTPSFGLSFSQLNALRDDMVMMAQKFALEGNTDAEFDCLVDVGVYEAMLTAHKDNPINR